MPNQEIFALIDRFEYSSLRSMKLSTQAFTLELNRDMPAAKAAEPIPAPAAQTPPSEGSYLTAPLVGTFYTASAPGQAPFASVGDCVKKGQTVCLIEAMKMMSEIPAPCDCVIEEVCKADGVLVAFDEPLFRYRPC